MKKLLICLCLVAASAFADQADTDRLNAMIRTALVRKDYDKARDLAVTAQQKEYVETEIVRAKQAKVDANNAARARRTTCVVSGNIATCN